MVLSLAARKIPLNVATLEARKRHDLKNEVRFVDSMLSKGNASKGFAYLQAPGITITELVDIRELEAANAGLKDLLKRLDFDRGPSPAPEQIKSN